MNFKGNESGFKLATNCEKMRVKLNEKDCILTTLAIIGSGIAGRSLLYNLSKAPLKFDKITLFSADSVTDPCTFNSTAIVALRGVTKGVSTLGDLIHSAFHEFKSHIQSDGPAGVWKISQISAATEKLDSFKKRFPGSKLDKIFLNDECEVFQEEAFLIDPKTYSDWLLNEARKNLGAKLREINDLVTEVENTDQIKLKTHRRDEYEFDKAVFATGSYQRFWKALAPDDSVLETSKPAQGSYFEFNGVHLPFDSFSLTFNGMNLIWNKSLERLLVGSTTSDVCHLIPSSNELSKIYQELQKAISFPLPDIASGLIKVGLREKAKKREPYLFQEKSCVFIGGLYKNGYSLSIGMTKTLSHQYL